MKKLAIATICTVLLAGSWITTETLAQPRDNTTAGLTGLGSGDGFGDRLGWRLARLGWQLDLSDQQRSEIRAIIQAAMPQAQDLVQGLRANREDLLDSTRGGVFDESVVRSIADAQGDLVAELIVLKERTKAEIYPVLNPAQQLQLEQTLNGLFR